MYSTESNLFFLSLVFNIDFLIKGLLKARYSFLYGDRDKFLSYEKIRIC